MTSVHCSSNECINALDGYCTLEEINLDRLIWADKDNKTNSLDHCFECLDYSDGAEDKLRKSLLKFLEK